MSPTRRLIAAWLAAGLLLAESVAPANTFVPEDAHPGDTRSPAPASGPPWSCVGRLEEPDHRFMTATLVGPDLVVTAAHGLLRAGRFKPGRFFFRPDAENLRPGTGVTARVTRAWVGSFTPDREADVHADWALLQLDRALGRVCGTLSVDDLDAASLAGDDRPLFLASYNRDFRRGWVESWQAGGHFAARDPAGYLLHDLSTDNGASGAPILHLDNRAMPFGAQVAALNVAEKTTGGVTIRAVPFTLATANVAIAAHEFCPVLRRILAGLRLDPSYSLP